MKIIDYRSDTKTLPTEEMMEAIRTAELGDDQSGEDPTVNRLEELAAKKLGKEAAILTTSGVQGNLMSLMAQTTRGDQIILDPDAHIYNLESGAFSTLGGLIPRLVDAKKGIIDPTDIKKELRPPSYHVSPITLISIENTHNSAGGTTWSLPQIKSVYDLAKSHDLKIHMDGARIFNAAVALNIDVSEIASNVDSVMFCLSKGLSAPIGSMVVGDEEFIDRARRYRKMLGGAMRQAGIIAAAGIVAIEKMVDRLEEDHVNARLLAEGLSQIPGISIDLSCVQTNIVRYDVNGLGVNGKSWATELYKDMIKVDAGNNSQVRMATHRHIDRDDIEYTLSTVQKVANQISHSRACARAPCST